MDARLVVAGNVLMSFSPQARKAYDLPAIPDAGMGVVLGNFTPQLGEALMASRLPFDEVAEQLTAKMVLLTERIELNDLAHDGTDTVEHLAAYAAAEAEFRQVQKHMAGVQRQRGRAYYDTAMKAKSTFIVAFGQYAYQSVWAEPIAHCTAITTRCEPSRGGGDYLWLQDVLAADGRILTPFADDADCGVPGWGYLDPQDTKANPAQRARQRKILANLGLSRESEPNSPEVLAAEAENARLASQLASVPAGPELTG